VISHAMKIPALATLLYMKINWRALSLLDKPSADATLASVMPDSLSSYARTDEIMERRKCWRLVRFLKLSLFGNSMQTPRWTKSLA